MDNRFGGYALPNLQIHWVFTCSLYCTWFFLAENLLWCTLCAMNTLEHSIQTFPCQLLKRRNRNHKMDTGPMPLVPPVPQKTVTPLKHWPSVNPAQFRNTSYSMTGLALCNILTPINPFHKRRLLNTLWAGLMGLCRNTFDKKRCSSSVWKSGLVRFFDAEGPCQKNWTGPQKDHRPWFFVVFRLVLVFTGFNWFITGL